jgi:uncharacterized protein YfaQ (DUF2300 family)
MATQGSLSFTLQYIKPLFMGGFFVAKKYLFFYKKVLTSV